MKFSPAVAARQLQGILERHGLSVESSGSNLSSSRYLEVSREGEDADGYEWPTLKVRLSTHEARPTYERLNGAADVEIGTHMLAHVDTAVDAALRILEGVEIEPDGKLRGALKRRATRQQIERRAAERYKAEMQQAIAAARARQ